MGNLEKQIKINFKLSSLISAKYTDEIQIFRQADSKMKFTLFAETNKFGL